MTLQTILDFAKDKDTIKSILTEESKKALLEYLNTTAFPMLKDVMDEYLKQLEEQSRTQTGWVKFRDSIFIPLMLTLLYNLLSKSTAIMIEKTK